jgi:hypothetical protein
MPPASFPRQVQLGEPLPHQFAKPGQRSLHRWPANFTNPGRRSPPPSAGKLSIYQHRPDGSSRRRGRQVSHQIRWRGSFWSASPASFPRPVQPVSLPSSVGKTRPAAVPPLAGRLSNHQPDSTVSPAVDRARFTPHPVAWVSTDYATGKLSISCD